MKILLEFSKNIQIKRHTYTEYLKGFLQLIYLKIIIISVHSLKY